MRFFLAIFLLVGAPMAILRAQEPPGGINPPPAGGSAPAPPTAATPRSTASANGDNNPVPAPAAGAAGGKRLVMKLGERGYYRSFVEQGRRVWVLLGGVELAGPDILIRAAAVVLWSSTSKASSRPRSAGPDLQVYAEGQVRLRVGGQEIDAERVFVNLETGAGQVWDAVLKGVLQGGAGARPRDPSIPRRADVYLRAKRILLRDRLTYEAQDAVITPSSFAVPVTSISAGTIMYRVTAPGRVVSTASATVAYEGVPLLWIPPVAKNIDRPLPLRRVRPHSSREFGRGVRTRWNLLSVAEYLWPWDYERYDARGRRLGSAGRRESGKNGETGRVFRRDTQVVDLDVDTLSKRGTLLGLSGKIERGALRETMGPGGVKTRKPVPEFTTTWNAAFIRDRDSLHEDPFFSGRLGPAPGPRRGRVMLFHRQHLSEDWELDLRYSQESDRDFLVEFFENEAKEEALQETYVQLRNHFGASELRLTYRVRTDEFQTVLEELPTAEFLVDSVPLWEGGALWSSTNTVSNRRFLFDQNELDVPGARAALQRRRERVVRLDTEQRVDVPLGIAGPLSVTPFGGGRYTVANKTSTRDNWHARAQAFAGTAVRLDARREFDVKSTLLELNGLIHTFTPLVRYENLFATTDSSGVFINHDAVDTGARRDVLTLSMENVLETRRGEKGKQSVTPWLEHRVDTLLFPQRKRSHTGRRAAVVEQFLTWYVTRRARLTAFASYEPHDRLFEEVTADLGYQWSPGLRLTTGQRVVNKGTARVQTTSWGLDAALSDRYQLAADVSYDWRLGRGREWNLQLTRVFHDFRLNIGVNADLEERDVTVFFTLDPVSLISGALSEGP